MIGSLIYAIIVGAFIYLSGWIKVLFSMISFSLGSRIPFLYLFFGISIGYGKSLPPSLEYWYTIIPTLIIAVIVTWTSASYAQRRGMDNATVPTCGGSISTGTILGMISKFIFH